MTRLEEVVRTEALRIARGLIKRELKARGVNLAKVEASEITDAAVRLLNADPSVIEAAKREVLARQEAARRIRLWAIL